MITGAVVVDLTTPSDEDPETRHHADRQALMVLPLCPDGAHVVVDLGSRRYVGRQVADLLHEHDHRLRIEICGSDPRAVAQLVRAARSGQWEVA